MDTGEERFNPLSTDNPQSDADQIRAEKGGDDREDDDARPQWTAEDMGEDPTKAPTPKFESQSASKENLKQLGDLMGVVFATNEMEIADYLSYIKPEEVQRLISGLRTKIEARPSSQESIARRFKDLLKALANYSA
jgi:hypothetical protein